MCVCVCSDLSSGAKSEPHKTTVTKMENREDETPSFPSPVTDTSYIESKDGTPQGFLVADSQCQQKWLPSPAVEPSPLSSPGPSHPLLHLLPPATASPLLSSATWLGRCPAPTMLTYRPATRPPGRVTRRWTIRRRTGAIARRRRRSSSTAATTSTGS